MKNHKLSYGLVTIDYRIMFDVIANCVGLNKQSLEREMVELQTFLSTTPANNYSSELNNKCRRIVKLSQDLERSVNTYNAFLALKERNTLMFVGLNKEVIVTKEN